MKIDKNTLDRLGGMERGIQIMVNPPDPDGVLRTDKRPHRIQELGALLVRYQRSGSIPRKAGSIPAVVTKGFMR